MVITGKAQFFMITRLTSSPGGKTGLNTDKKITNSCPLEESGLMILVMIFANACIAIGAYVK